MIWKLTGRCSFASARRTGMPQAFGTVAATGWAVGAIVTWGRAACLRALSRLPRCVGSVFVMEPIGLSWPPRAACVTCRAERAGHARGSAIQASTYLRVFRTWLPMLENTTRHRGRCQPWTSEARVKSARSSCGYCDLLCTYGLRSICEHRGGVKCLLMPDSAV